MANEDSLEQRLLSPDWKARFSAFRELEKKATVHHTPVLVSLLHDPESGIRIKACDILVRLGATTAAANIAPLLEDPWYGCRSAAARALLKLDPENQVSKVAPLVEDPHLDVKATVLDAIVELRASEYADCLVPLLKVTDHYLDIRSAEALCDLGGKSFLPRVLPLLKSKDEIVRLRAVRLIGEFGAEEYADVLLSMTDDRDPEVRMQAGLTLAKLRPDAHSQRLVSWLEAAAVDHDPADTNELRQLGDLVAAMKLLVSHGRVEAIPAIARFLRHVHSEMAGWAALSLSRLGSKDRLEAITAMSSSEDEERRLPAGIALVRLGVSNASEQLKLLEEVVRWREDHLHSCMRTGTELELEWNLLDSLFKAHAPGCYDVLSMPRVLVRSVQTLDDLRKLVEESGLSWHGAEEGTVLYRHPPEGMKSSLFAVVSFTGSGTILVPKNDGVGLIRCQSGLEWWKDRLARSL